MPLCQQTLQITNTASISGNDIANPVTAAETISTENGTNLSINKSLSPTTITENGQITYTFVIENFGNTAAAAEVLLSISDVFTPALNNISVTYNSAPWAETATTHMMPLQEVLKLIAGKITVPAATYTQDPATGAWSIAPGTTTITITDESTIRPRI